MTALWQDLKYGTRMLAKSPAFTVVAVLTLALGIGGTSAIFSVVNAVLLRPLAYSEPERIITIWENNLRDGEKHFDASYPNFLAWREQSRSFESMAGASFDEMQLSGIEEPVELSAAWVSREMFDVLRVRPVLGRGFTAEEDRLGGSGVVILSHAQWQRRFGGDAGAVGKQMILDGMPYTVVGVMPPKFDFPSESADVFLPLAQLAWTRQMKNRSVHIVMVMGRLKPEVPLPQARAEMQQISQRLQLAYPSEDPEHGIVLVPLQEEMVGSSRELIWVLFGAVGFVLLIACANVANLMLGRAATRQREMAIRAALGGSRWAIARLLLAESVVLALLSGAIGLLFSLWGVEWLTKVAAEYIPRVQEVRVDAAVLSFTFLTCVLCGLGFGLAPARQATRGGLNEALKEGATLGAGPSRSRGRQALVVVEVSLSLILLAGAGLMLKSLWLLLQVNPGFRAEQVLTLPVSLPAAEYDEPPSWIRFYGELPARLEALPGVAGVSAVNRLPISGGDSYGSVTIEGHPFPLGQSPVASFRRVLPSYFRLMGIPLRQGREFGERDTGEGQMAVIINENMARLFWLQGDAIGRRIKIGPPENEPWLTIVGVVGDVHNIDLDTEPALATYEPFAQRPRSSMTLVIRTKGEPLDVASAVHSELRAAEKQLLIGTVSTMELRISGSLGSRRLQLYLLGLFAVLALLLAGLGIYGVMAHAVSRTTREIGIRMALGARQVDVLQMVMRRGLTLALMGAGLGLAGAVVVTRWIAALLYGVQPADPLTFSGATLLLIGVATLACWIPARRATRVDPMVALRYE